MAKKIKKSVNLKNFSTLCRLLTHATTLFPNQYSFGSLEVPSNQNLPFYPPTTHTQLRICLETSFVSRWCVWKLFRAQGHTQRHQIKGQPGRRNPGPLLFLFFFSFIGSMCANPRFLSAPFSFPSSLYSACQPQTSCSPPPSLHHTRTHTFSKLANVRKKHQRRNKKIKIRIIRENKTSRSLTQSFVLFF